MPDTAIRPLVLSNWTAMRAANAIENPTAGNIVLSCCSSLPEMLDTVLRHHQEYPIQIWWRAKSLRTVLRM
jgi:hypothetical protein